MHTKPLFAAAVAAMLAVPAVPAFAAAPGRTPEAVAAHAEIASLRRELAAALIVKRLALTPEQKNEIKRVVADLKTTREALRADDELAAIREQREALLRKAIEEARATGLVSSETRDALKALRTEGRDERKEHAPAMKEAMEKLRNVLTAEQKQALRDMRKEIRAEGVGMHGSAEGDAGAKKHGGFRRGKMAKLGMMKLLLSDELAAELDR